MKDYKYTKYWIELGLLSLIAIMSLSILANDYIPVLIQICHIGFVGILFFIFKV